MENDVDVTKGYIRGSLEGEGERRHKGWLARDSFGAGKAVNFHKGSRHGAVN